MPLTRGQCANIEHRHASTTTYADDTKQAKEELKTEMKSRKKRIKEYMKAELKQQE